MPDAASTSLVQAPADTPEYMWGAWYACLIWASGETDIVAAFEADAGVKLASAFRSRSPLDRMTDRATGFERDVITKWGEWFNANVWGPMDGPPDGEDER